MEKPVMPRYIPYDYNQQILMPVSLKDQILPGTMEYVIHHLVEEELDLSSLEDDIKNDNTGRPAIDPKIMFKIVLLAYSKGIIYSRRIEKACRENVLFMALACGIHPDHSTIASFILGMNEKLLPLFQKVLLICDRQGLLGGTHFSLDGLKLPSNASKEWSGTFDELQLKKEKLKERLNKMFKDHQRADAEDAEHEKREKEKTDKKLKQLKADISRIEEFIEDNEPKMGSRNKEIKSNITDNESGKMSTSHGVIQGYNSQALVDDKHQIVMVSGVTGEGQDNNQAEPILDKAKENMQAIGYDEDYFRDKELSADSNYHSEKNLIKCDVEGIDAYIPDPQFRQRDDRFAGQEKHKDKKEQKYDKDCFEYNESEDIYTCPAGKNLKLKARRHKIGNNIFRRYQAKEKDCKGCKLREDCLRDETSRFKHLAIFIEKAEPTLSQKMKEKIDKPESKLIYDKRIGTVEPVFGNIRFIKQLNRFTMRGKSKVDIQWMLYCLVHNVEKLLNYGNLSYA